MAIEHYYASTARNAKDVAQYAIYPLFKMLSLMAFKDSHKANVVAGVATSAFYAGLTSLFFGLETDAFNDNVRLAVAAELGKKPNELKFSDFLDSENRIVKKRMELFSVESSYRYPVSLLPMLPTAMEYIARSSPMAAKKPPQFSTVRYRPKETAPPLDHFMHGWNMWDSAVYAGVAGMWLGETFFIKKSGAYELHKVSENEESVNRKIDANDLIGIYNRSRADADMPMLDTKPDREKIWPLMEEIAAKMNSRPHFNLPEVAYLMGMGKLDIFAKGEDGKEVKDKHGYLTVDPVAYDRAREAIELVDRIGLEGICEKKRRENVAAGKAPEKQDLGFVNKLKRNFLDFQFNSFQGILAGRTKQSEFISPRDGGEVPLSIP